MTDKLDDAGQRQKALNSMDARLYDSAQRRNALSEEIGALIEYRELIRQFVGRAIKTRYKRSLLGVAWTMLNPLLTMLVLTVVFSQLFRLEVANYPVYVLSGLVMWGFFAGSTSTAMTEMLWSGSLLGRIYVPKSIFAISAVGAGIVNLLLALIPLFIIAIGLHVKITPAILVMPFSILILAIFGLGIGLLLSTAVVYFADMLPVYEVLLVIWMYSTPVIYPLEIVPERAVWLIKLNPLYYMLSLFRDPLYYGTAPGLSTWLIASIFALLALAAGGLIFTAKCDEFAYRI